MPPPHPSADGYELSVALFSALLFTGPAEELAARHAAQGTSPVHRYRITWRTPAGDGALMSPHEMDVSLTFGNLDAAVGLHAAAPEAAELSATLRSAWTAFARTGSPLTERTPEWPAYGEEKPVLVLAPEPTLAADVDGELIRAAQAVRIEGVNWFSVFG
ncbi:carboxylesterase family protein [Brachybacterium sp. J144]|uniref:carboxylesterase family protein n=1 Tax=Brachybacterium sp. J144 TaxID=3116487 RepID=UPI002E786F92|nr:carboxylesterase family protein [Brachybacterium sp. J144]MEE1650293.1 carboxylesterase family protein [Brachybacterium sp. J144]